MEREITVPDGVNFRTITVHKAVVGGDPQDKADRRDWPGCVSGEYCKLKSTWRNSLPVR